MKTYRNYLYSTVRLIIAQVVERCRLMSFPTGADQNRANRRQLYRLIPPLWHEWHQNFQLQARSVVRIRPRLACLWMFRELDSCREWQRPMMTAISAAIGTRWPWWMMISCRNHLLLAILDTKEMWAWPASFPSERLTSQSNFGSLDTKCKHSSIPLMKSAGECLCSAHGTTWSPPIRFHNDPRDQDLPSYYWAGAHIQVEAG